MMQKYGSDLFFFFLLLTIKIIACNEIVLQNYEKFLIFLNGIRIGKRILTGHRRARYILLYNNLMFRQCRNAKGGECQSAFTAFRIELRISV